MESELIRRVSVEAWLRNGGLALTLSPPAVPFSLASRFGGSPMVIWGAGGSHLTS